MPENGRDVASLHEAADEAVESTRSTIERICEEVWGLAETGLTEDASAAVHLRHLTSAGFSIVGTGTSGVPTAFLAEWTHGDGGPKIGFLPEYDALPGLGNEAVPKREPRADGTTAGHGCGHNLLGAALSGAAIAAKAVMESQGIPGTLRVYGCAAEETEGAKVYMVRDGLFDDLDACLHWHPAPLAGVLNVRLSAQNQIIIRFTGRTAHAAQEPWQGRSALHALELAAHGLNLMREHLEPTARLHYVFEEGGLAPNIVTDRARIRLTVRDIDRAHVIASTEWIRQIAAGAAMATQTEAEVEVYFGMYDLLPNAPLAGRMQHHVEAVGVPRWSDADQEFARAIQREIGLPEVGMATTVVPLLPEPALGGSSDVADVSWRTPTMGVAMPTAPLGVPAHHWAMTASAGAPIGLGGAIAATRVLTRTTLDLATDAALRDAARADFARRTNGTTYESPLPPGLRHPLGVQPGVTLDGLAPALEKLASSGQP